MSIQNVLLWPACNYGDWSVASSITLCCIPALTSIIRCLKLTTIMHFCLVDSLLHYAPNFIFNWIEVGVVGRSKICRDECRSLALKKVDCLVRPFAGAPSCWKMKNSSETWRMARTHAATVMTAARHDNRLGWPWLRNWRISNWCNLILILRLSGPLVGKPTEF